MKAKKIIISIILFLISFICIENCVYATTIEVSNDSPKVGDSIKITVSVPNVHAATVFADISGAGISGQIKVVGGDMMGNKTTLSNSITVTPTSAGTITVSITSDSTAVADGQYVNVAAFRLITVSESTPVVPPSEPTTPPIKSSNAKLKILGIKPNDFPGFNANNQVYEVTVPNDVLEVEVYATAQDPKATISGTGIKKLDEGVNALKVVVTAEDGITKNTYIILVTRQVAEEEITLIGDVNEDGKITLADYTKILAHVKKTQLLTGDALKAADVNQDGKVTLADYTKVLAHVKKTALLF